MMKYKAFISYRHLEPDRTVAVTVQRMLEKFLIPFRFRRGSEKRFGRIFRDEDELPLSSDLSDSIQIALRESEFLIMICSPQLRESIWCMQELDTFLRLRGRNRVLTVLVSGTPQESFPPQLLTDENGDPCEPLAVNLTSGTSRRRILRKEYLRLAAAMIGCEYDDLVQRARRRRTRLLSAVLALALAAAAAFISVLLVKNAQVSRAFRQAQQNESEAMALLAENMLSQGDRIGALQSAAAVLPGPEDPERPYVAACEKVLADALLAYHDPRLFVQRATVNTFGNIKSLVVAKDGSLAFVGHEAGRVTAISPDGSILWEAEIPGWEKRTFLELIMPDSECLLVSASTLGFCRLDPATGRILRQEDAQLLAPGMISCCWKCLCNIWAERTV